MDLKVIKRVITGHDSEGKAIALENNILKNVHNLKTAPGTVFHEVWNTEANASISATTGDVTSGALILPPPIGGTRFRFVDIPPDHEYLHKLSPDDLKATFKEIGDDQAGTSSANSKHPLMHRTQTIDYGIVISGTITLILDNEEVEVSENSVIIQRGTNHAWSNRTDQVCRMAFILIDANYDSQLSHHFSG